MLQSNVTPAEVESVDDPQLSTSVTKGAEGIVVGAAVPDPAGLTQPFAAACVTVYVPEAVTVIELVV